MAIGRIGSFATTEAPKDPLLDTLQNIEQVGFQRRAEQRLIDDAKKKAKEEEDKIVEADIAKIKSDTTKFPTQNALIIDAMSKLSNGVAQKAKDYQAGKISKTDYNIYKTNAQQQIGLIDQAAKRINVQATDFAKLVSEGKIPPGFEENALNAGGAYDKNNIHLELNPDGTFTSYLYDDKDPNSFKILDKGGLAEFGVKPFVPVLNYDLDKDKKEFITTYPKVLNEKFVGMTKVGTKSIAPEIEKAIDLKVNAILANKNALAIKAKEITGQANPEVNDPDLIEEVRKKLKDEFVGMYAPEKMVDEATQRANTAIAKKKAEEDEVKRSIFRNETPLRNDVTGVPIPKDVMRPNFVGVEEGKVTFKNLGGEKGYGTGYVTSAGLEKDGHIVVTGKALKTKGVTFRVPKEDGGFKIVPYDEAVNSKEPAVQAELEKYNVADNYSDITKIYSVDTPELNSIAIKMGYDGVKGLKSELNQINKEEIEKSKQKKKPIQFDAQGNIIK